MTVAQLWGTWTLVCGLVVGSVLKVTHKPPFERPTAVSPAWAPWCPVVSLSHHGQLKPVRRSHVGAALAAPLGTGSSPS